MKTLSIMFFLLLFATIANGQCNALQNAVASSRDTLVQINTNATFVITPNDSNSFVWELTDFNGNLLDDDTTTNTSPIFIFNTPFTDSMTICQTVTNSSSGVICKVCDTLTYGGSIRHWEISSTNNTGVNTSVHDVEQLIIESYPNPVTDIINIVLKKSGDYQLTLYSLEGKNVLSAYNSTRLDVSLLPQGIYFLEIKDMLSGQKVMKKIAKL